MSAEAALAVIAKAILSQAGALAAKTVATRATRLLRKDPVERAIADALGEALRAVERKHPGVANAWFDEKLLKSEPAAAVLARCLVAGEDPDAEDLADALSPELANRGVEGGARAEIVVAAGDLLLLFERALDARERQDALGELRVRRAARATADAVGQLASWVGSQRHRVLIKPDQRYGELELDRFAGREWLTREIDEFLRTYASGYFVIQGAAGIGKSAFAAWLARERSYAVHFVRLARGRNDTSAALSNLAVQLADAWPVDVPISLHGCNAARVLLPAVGDRGDTPGSGAQSPSCDRHRRIGRSAHAARRTRQRARLARASARWRVLHRVAPASARNLAQRLSQAIRAQNR
jgi:hypothetical protein